MNRMVLHSRVGSDGVLHITVPIGKEDADREVQVTIDPLRAGPPSMTQEEWRAFVPIRVQQPLRLQPSSPASTHSSLHSRRPRTTTATPFHPPPSCGPTKNGNGGNWVHPAEARAPCN